MLTFRLVPLSMRGGPARVRVAEYSSCQTNGAIWIISPSCSGAFNKTITKSLSVSSLQFNRCSPSSFFTLLKSCSMMESLQLIQMYSARTTSKFEHGCRLRASGLDVA